MTTITRTLPRTLPRLAVIAAAALLTLSGCATAAGTPEREPSATGTISASVSVRDSWVKAADEGMSAAFGTIENSGDADITVLSATTSAASMVELHETIANDAGEMVMQAREGGFVVPAGGSLVLAPGGNHIMFMGLTAALRAGDEVTVTLTLSDGSTFAFTAPVKDYSGANETYEGDMNTNSDD